MPSRVVRGEINSSESLNQVSMEADLTFRALIVAVDDFGRFDARPAIVKAALFPLRGVSTDQVMGWIGELQAEGCVQLYEVEGRPYLQLSGWEKHRGKSRRAAESKFPAIPGDCTEPREIPGDPGKSPEIRPGLGVESRESRVGGNESAAAPPRAKPDPAPKAKRGTGCPEDLTDEQWAQVRAWQEKKHPEYTESHLSNEWDRHVDWHVAHGSTRKDWVRSFYGWLTNGIGVKPTTSTARADPKPFEPHAGPRLVNSVEDAERLSAEFAELRNEDMPKRRFVT